MEDRIIRKFQGEPTLRVKVANEKPFWDFALSGTFSLVDDDGRVFFDSIRSDLRWRVSLESYEPAQYIYSLLVGVTDGFEKTENFLKKLAEKGFEPRIQQVGGDLLQEDQLLSRNVQYRILVGEFNSEEDARAYGWKSIDSLDGVVVREKIRESRGILEVFDAEYDRVARIDNGTHIKSLTDETEVVLYDVQDENNGTVHRRCRLPLTFRVGVGEGIIGISEVPLETYLKNVLSSGIHPSFPKEALKSQAVVSRGWALSNLGIQHYDEPFDVCAFSHCQDYGDGTTMSEAIESALRETAGEFLFYKDVLCRTPYTIHCGGVTEDRNGFSHGEAGPYIQSVFDGPDQEKKFSSLKGEKQLKQWIASLPKVYCNPFHRSAFTFQNRVKNSFRWENTYSRKELEEIIRRKTGADIGTLIDILPVKRSRSGRLREIEVLGTRKNIRIRRQKNIRSAFSEECLNSSCFIIEKRLDGDGFPISFSFIGAGNGEGIGLCQTGAVCMALEGKQYDEILQHYFKKVGIKKVY